MKYLIYHTYSIYIKMYENNINRGVKSFENIFLKLIKLLKNKYY